MNFKSFVSTLFISCSYLSPLYGNVENYESVTDNPIDSEGFFSFFNGKTDGNEPVTDNQVNAEGFLSSFDDQRNDKRTELSLSDDHRDEQKICKGKPNESQPVLYYAESQTYDRDLGILILKGNVEFSHQGQVLEADYVTYNENTDRITASGNVRLRQPDGEVDFAEYVELTGNMKEGILLQLRTLLKDDSKLAALEGRKFEDRQELDKAVYTPCELCGDYFPTWQVNARRAVKDDANKDIIFTDAQFRLLDVPLFYFPYITQPLERRSGLLIPRPDYSSDFGGILQIPYYFALSEDKDLTLTPVFFTKQHPLLIGEYRQAFGNGTLNVEGSITSYHKSPKDKQKEKKERALRQAEGKSSFSIPETRGHIYGDLRLNLNEIWRFKAEGGYVSDKTYFRKYKFSGWRTQNALTSRAILEGFLNQRDYAALKVYHFQGLRVNTDHQSRISAPLPIAEYSAYSATDPWGGRFKFDGNLLNLFRDKGINMQRAIGGVQWQRPWYTPQGQVFTFFASTRGDLYKVEHSHNIDRREARIRSRRGHRLHDMHGGARFFPQTGLDWRWPFIHSSCGQSVIIEPLAQFIGAPSHPIGASNRKIPNEDSRVFVFNDANLFSPDRFGGYDRIDRGTRVVYGGEVLTTGALFGDMEAFFGQSYSLSDPQNKRIFQGLRHYASDYVGRIEAMPYEWLSLNYRFRLDKKTLKSRVAEVGGSIGPAIAKFSGTYVFVHRRSYIEDDLFFNRLKRRNLNQMNLTASSQFVKHWTIAANVIKNFEKIRNENSIGSGRNHNGILSKGVGLEYEDSCFKLGLSLTRQYYRSADLRPATIALVTLWLKNVGEHTFSFNVDGGLFGNRKPSNDTP